MWERMEDDASNPSCYKIPPDANRGLMNKARYPLTPTHNPGEYKGGVFLAGGEWFVYRSNCSVS